MRRNSKDQNTATKMKNAFGRLTVSDTAGKSIYEGKKMP